MQGHDHHEFGVNLAARSVTHTPTDTVFSFYRYETELEWQAALPAGARLSDHSPRDDHNLDALSRRAKAAALAAGMRAQ